MTRSRFSLVLLGSILLAACAHHHPPEQGGPAAPVPLGDAPLTGQPPVAYPRAALVALPPSASPSPAPAPQVAPPSVATTPPVTSTDSTPASAPPSTPPIEAPPAPIAAAPDNTTASGTPAPSSSPAATDAMSGTPTQDTSASPSSPGSSASPVAMTDASTAPAPAPDPQQVVVLQTPKGSIVIQLDDFAAPQTCANFRKLVASGFYDHTVFHRVISNFVIQGGDPNSKSENRATYGLGGPGYTLPAEIKLRHDRGAVAMARSPDSINPQRDSNGSQFYICVAPCPSLDDQYTVFAHVIKGMDVATAIADLPHDQRDDPLTRVEMQASLESKDQALQDPSVVNP